MKQPFTPTTVLECPGALAKLPDKAGRMEVREKPFPAPESGIFLRNDNSASTLRATRKDESRADTV